MSILNQDTANLTARLVRIEGDPSVAGFRLIRNWSHLAVEAATGETIKSLAETMNDEDDLVVDPYANQIEYEGSFVNGSVLAIDENIQGKATREGSITQTLTKIKLITDVASLGTPLTEATFDLLSIFSLPDALDQTGNDNKRYYFYMNLDPASLETTMALVPTYAVSGYTTLHKEFKINRTDKTGIFLVVFEKTDWSNSAGTKVRMGRGNVGGYGETKSEVGSGIPTSGVVALFDAETADTDFVLTNIIAAEKVKGESIIRKNQTATTETGNPYITIETNAVGRTPASKVHIWHRVDPDTISTVWTTAETYGVAGSYILLYRRRFDNPDGSATLWNKVIVSNEVTWGKLNLNTNYRLVRSFVEKSAKKPTENPSDLDDEPEDGYYWRIVYEYITALWSTSETTAWNHANTTAACVGSFSKYVRRGLFYAERVDGRCVSDWSDTSLADASGNHEYTGTPGQAPFEYVETCV